MKLFRFDPGVGQAIDKFGSTNVVLSRIVHLAAEAHISCMTFGPGGIVGYHQAAAPQLFLVVQGEGWVRGETPERVPIAAGRAALWEAGEWHESGSENGMTAIVVEGKTLDLI